MTVEEYRLNQDTPIRFLLKIGSFWRPDKIICFVSAKENVKVLCQAGKYNRSAEKNMIRMLETEISFAEWDCMWKTIKHTTLSWQNSYHNQNVLDGEQWRFESEFADGEAHIILGSNKYPKNWREFYGIFERYFEDESIGVMIDLNSKSYIEIFKRFYDVSGFCFM